MKRLTMKIILLEDIGSLGRTGDIITVKPGYAKNLLFPTKKAIIANKDNLSQFEEKKSLLISQNIEKFNYAERISNLIKEKFFVILSSSSDDGKLYGSIGTKQISNAIFSLLDKNKSNKINDTITDLNRYINGKTIVTNGLIKTIGIHEVMLNLYSGVNAKIYVNIAKSDGEAEIQKNEYLKNINKTKESDDTTKEQLIKSDDIIEEKLSEENHK